MSDISTTSTPTSNAKLILRLAPALLMILFGLNQLYYPEVWLNYIPSWIPSDHITFMRVHAIGNIVLGLLLASGIELYWTLTASLIWWFSIVVAAFPVDWTVGTRDLTIASSIVALYLLEYR